MRGKEVVKAKEWEKRQANGGKRMSVKKKEPPLPMDRDWRLLNGSVQDLAERGFRGAPIACA